MSVFEGLNLPKVIYQTSSEYNGDISVIQVGRTRRLSVDGLTQSINWDSPSCMRMYWGKAIEILKQNEPSLKKLMILGLGGGTLAHLVSKEFPGIFISSIEIDSVIVDVARQYFDLESIPNHQVTTADAMAIVSMPEKFGFDQYSFDALFVDIYCGDMFPELGKSGAFIVGIKNLVKPGGLVIFNRIYLENHQDDVNIFIDSLHDHFHDLKSVIVAGKTNSDNVLVFGRTS